MKLSETIVQFPLVYGMIACLSALFMTLLCLLAVPTVFRVRLRRQVPLWILMGLLCFAVGVTRFLCKEQNRSLTTAWDTAEMLLPYVSVALIVPFRSLWKGIAAAAGYVFVEAIKYIVLLLFFRAELQNTNFALQLLVEIAVHAAAFALVIFLLAKNNIRRNVFEPLLQIKPMLYILIVASFSVFVVTLVGINTTYSNTVAKQYVFVMLNIPLLSATIGYAMFSFVKARTAELNYKTQLEAQIKHYEMMEKMNEDLRIFRHDLPKKLRPMVAYLNNNDPAAAKEIAEELSAFNADSPLRFHTGNYRLDTVLFCQQQIAEKDNITVKYTYGSVFPEEGIAPDAIYTIFPNALDNAIEACRKTRQPCEITVSSKIMGDTVFVTITNPFSGEIKMKNGMPVTGKAEKLNHGYGARSIKKAAAQYGEDNVEFIVGDGLFTLRLSLRFR